MLLLLCRYLRARTQLVFLISLIFTGGGGNLRRVVQIMAVEKDGLRPLRGLLCRDLRTRTKTAFLQVLDFYWRSSESGGVWYK